MSYSFKGRVRYSEIGEDGCLTLPGIQNYYQDCCTFQSENIGQGMKALEERQRAWVLSSWQIVVNRYPGLGETIVASTAPYGFKGFLGMRNFTLKTEDGELLSYANSIWTNIDTETGLPARLTDEDTRGYELDEKLDGFIAACTTEDMTQEECLHACYEAVRALRYLGRNPAYGPEVKTIPYDKQLEFADKILSTGKGDCYNFAAVFCLLARKLGYLASPIVGECGYSWNWYPIAHGWVEIELDGETFLFDPQIENYNLRAGISNETHSAWQVTYESAPARYLKH